MESIEREKNKCFCIFADNVEIISNYAERIPVGASDATDHESHVFTMMQSITGDDAPRTAIGRPCCVKRPLDSTHSLMFPAAAVDL